MTGVYEILVCYKCKERLATCWTMMTNGRMPPAAWYMKNIAPNAASGGKMVPVHHRCDPGPSIVFGNRVGLVGEQRNG
jgi:hypothetical protein